MSTIAEGESAPLAEGQGAPAKPKRPPLGALKAILPYASRYKGRIALAIVALVVAAGATLALPLAVRRVIDLGFDADNAAFVNEYFVALIVVAGVLALASASRYYLVITLGERIVADVRTEVFTHLTGLEPAFFDANHSGEIVSRLTADTTQIKSAFGASASVLLRNLVLFVRQRRAHGLYEPAPFGLRLACHSADRAAARLLGTRRAGAFARRARPARRYGRLCGRADRRGAHASGLWRRAHDDRALRRGGRGRFRGRQRIDKGARLPHGGRHLPRSRERRRRLVDRRARRDGRRGCRPGRCRNSCSTRCSRARRSASFPRSGPSSPRRPARPSGSPAILRTPAAIAAPQAPQALPSPPQGRVAFERGELRLCGEQRDLGARRSFLQRGAGRARRHRRAVGRRQVDDLPAHLALLRSRRPAAC